MTDKTSIRVGVRVRPLSHYEKIMGCKEIVEVHENEQILLKSLDKDISYNFNYAFANQCNENDIYFKCVEPLIENLFKGYNATILAYGQTGSGKTHTMGTNYSGEGEMGVIPRAVNEIYNFVRENNSFDFNISVSFMELYQENLYDLLSDKPRDHCLLDIREDASKGIYIPNLTEIDVYSVKEVFEVLQKGTAGRVTSATAMNAQSSRSHAIFTINIGMNHKENPAENKQAKLHLVDLAGSERPKKTLATGNTFKEVVNINKGLLALGKVISCLGDEKSQHSFIPYRDSNLTRLLKDSLGGNSITLMIACVSPADYNLKETLSTLRYAHRVKKIKNKPVVNQDPKTAEINLLSKTIHQLRLQIVGQGGSVSADVYEPLQQEVLELRNRKRELNKQLSVALNCNTHLHEKLMILQNANEVLTSKLIEIKNKFDTTLDNITLGMETNNNELVQQNLIYLKEIKEQFIDIGDQQKKTEEEIHVHDQKKHKDQGESDDNEEEIIERQESHANHQLKLNSELTEIERILNLKEKLAKQLLNQFQIDPQAMVENEAKIAQLEREKEELMRVLKNVENSGKTAEQRRKHIQELEQQLTELKKKVQKQANMIKNKKEEKVNNLLEQLNNSQDQDNRDEEIEQLKADKQMLEHKLEQVTLLSSTNIPDPEMTTPNNKPTQQKMSKMPEGLSTKPPTLEFIEDSIDETKNLDNLKNDPDWRKTPLSKRVLEQKSRLEMDPEMTTPNNKPTQQKMSKMPEGLSTKPPTLEFIEDSIDETKNLDNLKNDPDWRKTPLSKRVLEQKSRLEMDPEMTTPNNKPTQRKMSKMPEGLSTKPPTLEFIEDSFDETKNLDDLKNDPDWRKTPLSKRVLEQKSRLEMDPEMTTPNNKPTQQKMSKMPEGLSTKPPTLEFIEDSIDETKNLDNLKNDPDWRKTPLSKRVLEQKSRLEMDPEMTPNNKPTQRKGLSTKPPTLEFIEDSCDETINLDDLKNDPDWRKTPPSKRVLKQKSRLEMDKPSKRSRSPQGCTCKTNCSGNRCGCKKLGRGCSSACKCNKEVCQNIEAQAEPSKKEDAGTEVIEEPKFFNKNLRKKIKMQEL